MNDPQNTEEEDFCFRRLTATGRVSDLRKDVSLGVCSLCFFLAIDRGSRPIKIFHVSGEIWGAQELALAEQVQEGSLVKIAGCLKEPDLAATIQTLRFDLEQLLEVANA